MTERFGVDWLILREAFDQAARDPQLMLRLSGALPTRRPRLLDLAAGNGSLFRSLAPIIGRGQDWLLVDADGDLLEDAFGRTAAWARRRGCVATAQDDTLLVHTQSGLWRMQASVLDVTAIDLPEADAVLCSALLDLVSRAWLERLCATLRVPFYAGMTIDGRDAWLPRHSADAVVRAAFRRDLRRDKGFGSALGCTAWSAALRALAARGFITASAPSDWRIPRIALRMQRSLIEGTADAARNAEPARDASITAWQTARLRQAMRAKLAIRVGHRDILALPPEG